MGLLKIAINYGYKKYIHFVFVNNPPLVIDRSKSAIKYGFIKIHYFN